MTKLIKDDAIVEDTWIYIDDDASLPPLGDVIVSLPMFEQNKASLLKRDGKTGVILQPGDGIEPVQPDLDKLALVAINFPVFTDGRGYSYARALRQNLGFQGEIRAIGDVLRDQLLFMKRCGFNAFEVRADRDLEDALNGLKDFTIFYQGDANDPNPIYRRQPA